MDPAQIFADVKYDRDALQLPLQLPVQAVGSAEPVTTKGPTSPEQFYDDDYFDTTSDEEEEEQAGTPEQSAVGIGASLATGKSVKKAKQKRKVVADEDLFYDPTADSDDEKWLKKRIAEKLATKGLPPQAHASPTLACPMCLTPLCHDCQQHDRYEGQFRAMFFENCVVDAAEVQHYPKAGKTNRKPLEGASSATQGGMDVDADDAFWPVRCEICATQVGVMDSEEVVHFFHVIAS
ncbi:hypothetical protein HDU87_002588 [Geranomyces variabilis]|uniref:E2F-associated phosphoprotein n=1 Tax=Geranomyces variabilis TaxID=109894 RepID=A0AAD5TUC4_9FUNG|nr:hypothetical protein HDU87_002588 [Geranomyces variabilis]